MSYDIYGVGNALVDIQARITEDLLPDLGFTKGVMTLVEEGVQTRVLGSLDGAAISRCEYSGLDTPQAGRSAKRYR